MRKPSFRLRWTAVSIVLVAVLSVAIISFRSGLQSIGKPYSGVFLGSNLLVSLAQRDVWPGVKAGVRPLDRLIRVNDQPVFHGKDVNAVLQNIANQPSENEKMLTLRLARKGKEFEVSYPLPLLQAQDFYIVFLTPFVVGALFLLIGSFVYFARPRNRIALFHFYFCAAMATWCMTVFDSYTQYQFSRITLIYPLIVAMSFHLFTLFPHQIRSWSIQATVRSSYMIVGLLLALRQIYLQDLGISILLTRLCSIYAIIMLLANFVLLAYAYIRTQDERARNKIRVLASGLGLATALLLMWLFSFNITGRMLYFDEALIVSLIFPIFLGYAILRQNLFDIDYVIRLGLSYGILGGVIMAGYVTLVTLLSRIAPSATEPQRSPVVFVLLALFAAFFILKARGKLQQSLLKVLFRSRYNTLRTLTNFSDQLIEAKEISEIHNILVADLVVKLRLIGAAYISLDQDRAVIGRSNGMNEAELRSIDWGPCAESLRSFGLPLNPAEAFEIGAIKEPDLRTLDRLNVALLFVLLAKDEPVGLLLLGSKRSHEAYTPDEITVLGTLMGQAAISIQNARLLKTISEKERLAAIGRVASIIIHEIKNPLGIIKVSSGTLKKRFDADDTGYELAEFIEEEVERMNRTIQEILQFARPSQIVRKKVNIDELVRLISEQMEPGFRDKGIELIVDTATNEQIVSADQEKLRRVFLNLLINAKEAVEEQGGGRVIVATRKQRGGILVRVVDNGSGFSLDKLPELFKPFYSTKERGTGLGLAIVQQIITQHQGKITAQANNEKGVTGACFEVFLPSVSRIDREIEPNKEMATQL